MSTQPNEPTSEAGFFSAIRSWGIVRGDERVFGGVLSGVGRRIGMAPAPARIIFVLLAIITGGLALLVYAAAWALLPDSEGRIIIQDFGRGTPNVGALVAIGVIAFIGFFTVDNWGVGDLFGWWNGADFHGMGDGFFPRWLAIFAVLIPLAVIGGIAWLIVWSVRNGREGERKAQGYARMPDGTVPAAPTAPDAPVAEAQDAPSTGAEPSPTEPVSTEPIPAESSLTEATATAVPLAASNPEPVYAAPGVTPPAYTPPVYSAPKHHYVPKPRVPGPGKFGYLAALALIPIVAAVTLYLHSTDQLAVFPAVAAGVMWVAGLGAILVINALRGRKAGFLGFVSVVALLPVGLSIAYASDIRERYADGDWSITWEGWRYESYEEWSSEVPEPEYTPPAALDASKAFFDFDTVAINGTCYSDTNEFTPDLTGTVRLSEVSADQTITVTATDTLLSIPSGTSLRIVNLGGGDGSAWSTVVWPDRDATCELQTVGSPAAVLTNTDAPVLTVQLDDTLTDGYQTLYIEEN